MASIEIREKLFQETEKRLFSPSHDRGHSERIIQYGLELQKIHGGDPEIIAAAAILHDLGRADFNLKAKESAILAGVQARNILQESGFPEEKIDAVCTAISEHDQADFTPSTIEGRILKDGDFLDGFGARGIFRSLLWSGERGESQEEILKRLKEKMPARIEGLSFPESKDLAKKQHRFVGLFLSLLEERVPIETEPLTGKYIVFEGISGTGKETQGRKLYEELTKKGIKCCLVFEPTPDLKPILRSWRSEVDDKMMELFTFIADRRRIMKRTVLPALRRGETVISIRNMVSNLVYQTESGFELALALYLQTFVPEADRIFWIDLAEEEALKRIGERKEERGKFEEIEKLRRHRKKYGEVLEKFENVVKINGEETIEEIHNKILENLPEIN